MPPGRPFAGAPADDAGAKPAETRLAPLPAAVPAIRRLQRSRCGAPSAAPGTDAAQRQEAAERVKHAAYRILQIAKLFRELSYRQPPPGRRRHRMAVEVLGRGVHHISNPCSSGRWIAGEAKVLSATLIRLWRRAMAAMALRSASQQRVGGRFHPDHARIGADRRFNSAGRRVSPSSPADQRYGGERFPAGGKCRHTSSTATR